MRICFILPFLMAVAAGIPLSAADGNRLTYLDNLDPYYVSRSFPRFTTPQWVGEEGVDAVVIMAVDDMRERHATVDGVEARPELGTHAPGDAAQRRLHLGVADRA